jgi:hypothetical protein
LALLFLVVGVRHRMNKKVLLLIAGILIFISVALFAPSLPHNGSGEFLDEQGNVIGHYCGADRVSPADLIVSRLKSVTQN